MLYSTQVLYSTFNGSSSVQMLAVLAQLSAEVLSDAAVAHALAVREATVSSNWVAFFKLYPKTPNTGGELMDLYKDTVRSLYIHPTPHVARHVSRSARGGGLSSFLGSCMHELFLSRVHDARWKVPRRSD